MDARNGRLAVCCNGHVIDLIPNGVDASDQVTREALFASAAAELGVNPLSLEILAVCERHPTIAAVDCLDCEPIES